MESESERKGLFNNLENRLEKCNVNRMFYSVGIDQYNKVCIVPRNSLYLVYICKYKINDYIFKKDFLDASYEFISRISQLDQYNKPLLEYQLDILTQIYDQKEKKELKYKK